MKRRNFLSMVVAVVMGAAIKIKAIYRDQNKSSIHVTTCDWDEVPHLSEGLKRELLENSIPPHQIQARKYGRL